MLKNLMYYNIQKYTEKLCKELAERFRDQNVELVIGPMTGGILLAHEVGKALGTPCYLHRTRKRRYDITSWL